MRKKIIWQGLKYYLLYTGLIMLAFFSAIGVDKIIGRDSLASNVVYFTLLVAIISFLVRLLRKQGEKSLLIPQNIRNVHLLWLLLLIGLLVYLFSYGTTVPERNYVWLYVLIQIAISTMEELFFRGIFLKVLSKWNVAFGVTVSSLLFIHYNMESFPLFAIRVTDTFCFAVLTALLVLYTKSLYPSILLHSLFNMAALFSKIWEADFFTASYIIIGVEFLLIVFLIYSLKRKGFSFKNTLSQNYNNERPNLSEVRE